MSAPPARTELADTFPSPDNATFRTGIGKLYDYVTGLLGATGNAADARVQLELVKDGTGGVPGLTLFKINFKNALNTFTSFFTNANTAPRTYTFPDRDGTIADNTDLAGKAPLSGKVTVASATTPDIFGAGAPLIDYTGTATATGFTAAAAAGMKVELYCAGACSFTAGENLLIEGIPSGTMITLAAGATVKVRAVTTTQFKMTYSVSGTFTATAYTGFTTTPSGTASYSVANGVATIGLPYLTGTSNSAGFGISGMPTCLYPTVSSSWIPAGSGQDNGVLTTLNAQVSSGGVITLLVGSSLAGFTASGAKFCAGAGLVTTLTYKIG